MFMGLVAFAGMGAARLAEDEVVTRRRAMRETINTLAAPLLDRLDRLARFRDVEIEHRIALVRFEGDLHTAERRVDMREINLKEYELGAYPSQVQALEGEITLAEANFEKANEKRELSDKMRKEGKVTELENQADRLAVGKAELQLEQARRQLIVLKDFTKIKRVTELQADIGEAHSHVRAVQSRIESLKATHEAARRKAKAEGTLSRDETRILVLLRDAITLQADKKLDEAQHKVDEAKGIAQIEEDRRSQERLLDTEVRLDVAILALDKSAPKPADE
jgi:hypothetical protein